MINRISSVQPLQNKMQKTQNNSKPAFGHTLISESNKIVLGPNKELDLITKLLAKVVQFSPIKLKNTKASGFIGPVGSLDGVVKFISASSREVTPKIVVKTAKVDELPKMLISGRHTRRKTYTIDPSDMTDNTKELYKLVLDKLFATKSK